MKSEIQINDRAEACHIDIEGTIGVPEEWQFDDPDERIATYDRFRDALRRILVEPKNAITRQYKKILELDGVELTYTDDALDLIVDKAIEYKLGARGLRSIVETVMVDAMYEAPSSGKKKLVIDAAYVREQLEKAHYEKMEITE